MGFYDLFGYFKGEVSEQVIKSGPDAPRPPTAGLDLPKGCYIPDYKIYKLENAPELIECQKKLAARGLKSPWLRNDVWRYERKIMGTYRWRQWYVWGLGFKYGLPLFAVTLVYEIYFKKPDHSHHHYDNLYYKNSENSHQSHH